MTDPRFNSELLEAIEACRPGSDDLAMAETAMAELAAAAQQIAEDPRARDLYERTQVSDALLAEVFHEVEVPKDLEAKLLASFAAATLVESPLPASYTAAPASAVSVRKPEPERVQATRRYWIATALSLSLIAALSAALWLSSGKPVGIDRALTDAATAQNLLAQQAASLWQSMASAPATHPFPGSQIRVAPAGWSPVAGLGDGAAVAYGLGPQATLFVFRPHGIAQGMPASPPANPKTPGGSGVNFGVWSANGLVYVLRVEGSSDDYRRAIVRTSSPLA